MTTLTVPPDIVDARADVGGAVWVSVSELARLKSVSKQAVSSRLGRLEAEGLIEIRIRGREKQVRLAQWDTVTHETTDPARLIGQGRPIEDQPPSAGRAPSDPSYTQELTRKARYDADLREIEIGQKVGKLLRIDDVTAAMSRCAEAIVREVDQLPSATDDIVAAFNRGGVAGVREALKSLARRQRETLARTMTLMGMDGDA